MKYLNIFFNFNIKQTTVYIKKVKNRIICILFILAKYCFKLMYTKEENAQQKKMYKVIWKKSNNKDLFKI